MPARGLRPALLLALLLITASAGWPVRAQAPARPASTVADPAELRELISMAASVESIGERIALISARFLGRPYLRHPLHGSPNTPETLVTRLDGFDCVTFVETVLALAHARTPADFERELALVRYRDGHVDWADRLHYATAWAAAQVARGRLEDLTTGPATLLRQKTLDYVPGLPPREVTYRYFPKRAFPLVAPTLRRGDIIFFVSGSPGLDANHVGLVIEHADGLWLRNASRQQRAVVDQPLDRYFARHPMAGFFVTRPR